MPLNIEIHELKPPVLEFGADGEYLDPRLGLLHAGPFSLRFGKSHKSQVRVGIVGPEGMIERTRRWFDRCQGVIPATKISPMYVDFPGFENAFQSFLAMDGAWVHRLDRELAVALAKTGLSRFESAVAAYSHAVGDVSRNHRVDVVVCCIPPEVIASCRTVSRSLTPVERAKLRAEKRREDSGQLVLCDVWNTDPDPEELLQRDFRRALKAAVMTHRMPIQIVTNNLLSDEAASQDPATRAWNSNVAIFYKSGGLPWRLRLEGPETCFVGLSFHHLRTSRRHLVYSSVAQAFSTDGDGFALRGESVEPPDFQSGKSLHLNADQAASLAGRILSEYRDRTGREPARIVLHKTTQFNDEERRGFLGALAAIPITEFVNIIQSDFRLVQRSAYPPKRGTLCQVNGNTFLFTTGFIPEWNTYPGVHVPVPVRIRTDRGVDRFRSAVELLGLARMNWNTAFDTTGAPITLRFAREVGGIMAELLDREPEPSYRYYM